MRIRVTSFTKHADRNPFHLRVHGTRAANGHVDNGSAEEHQRWGGGPCKCVAEWVHFELANVDPEITEHTHDIDVMDGYKRSEALAVLAKNKCEEGNSYSATTKWMHKMFGETSRQVYKFEKGDVANAAQGWRSETRDLVLREEVPEDSEEMTTMRKCVDAILEADALSLRAALREVLKDSHDLTKSALAILEKHKPAVPTQNEPEEPWRLTEGVTILDLPSPGPSGKLRELAGVYGPPRTPYPPLPSASQTFRLGQGYHLPATFAPNVLGPDGRPVSGVMAPGAMAQSQGNAHNGYPQTHTYQQHHGQTPVNAPQARGVPLQPRPPAPAHGAPYNVQVQYVQVPPSPSQRGSLHPITVSMEVPSCALNTCKQCRHLHRDLAGRTFFFQDRLHTPAHFTKLQNLLRDPKQLLNDDYMRVSHQAQLMNVHPPPALQIVHPQRSNFREAPPPQRAPASAPNVSQVQQIPSSGQPHPLPVPVVIEDDDSAATGDKDNNGGDKRSAGESGGGDKVDDIAPEQNGNSEDVTAGSADDEDEDGQRPAKRRRQESVAEE